MLFLHLSTPPDRVSTKQSFLRWQGVFHFYNEELKILCSLTKLAEPEIDTFITDYLRRNYEEKKSEF